MQKTRWAEKMPSPNSLATSLGVKMTNKKDKEEKKDVVLRGETMDLAKPSDAFELAKTLKKIISQNGLATNIKGREYINVEGWQLAGAFTGIFPRIDKVEREATGTNEIKYRAEATLYRIKDKEEIGFGVAFCSNREYSKRQFDEYAIASMAQTRAIGKAYRITLGWLIKLAGYEATPSEEMPSDQPHEAAAEEKIDQTTRKFGTPNQAGLTEAQVAWLRRVYRQYEGYTDADASAKVASFKTREEAQAEASRLSEEYGLN